MNSRRRGYVLIGAAVVLGAAIAPAHLGDSRLPVWMAVVRDTKLTIGRAVAVVQRVIGSKDHHLDLSQSQPVFTQIGPALEMPQAVRDGTALRQAYLTAAANERIRSLGYDPTGIEDAIAAYKAGNVQAGDAIAGRIDQPLVRAALEWVALHDATQKISLSRLQAFATAHADWPSATWLRRQTESHLAHVTDPKVVERYFATSAPATAIGRYALAKALKADNRGGEAAQLARAVFRESDILTGALETKFKTEFGADLTKADYKYRADRLLYKEQVGPALHLAAIAGPDELALAKARAAVIGDVPSDKAMAAVPDSLRKDPGFILAEVQRLRRSDRLMDAANLMQSAPRTDGQLIDGDAWWTERRVLARRLLDNGNINAAYVICATHGPASDEANVEAEFHAGWIALRFMNDPARAAYHFAQAAKIAETPTSVARIAYWQGRAAENLATPDAVESARRFYQKAAVWSSTYYGQLARQLLGISSDLVKAPTGVATGTDRNEALRVIELLYAAGEREAAYSLATEAAEVLQDPRQVGALAAIIEDQGDAHLALTLGKLLGQHGMVVDTLAFPIFGIPHYDELQGSAPPPIVYAIARQESAFLPSVVSKAGAKGLMQIIETTAKHTAIKAGIPFDANRLTTDPAFNAQLGAAHLGELMAEQSGSLILTFAAYNAGGLRVKQWIDAYGDPRDPGVDPVDWVERIPFTETRNYVQRVMANVAMYKAIFADRARPVAGREPDREAKL